MDIGIIIPVRFRNLAKGANVLVYAHTISHQAHAKLHYYCILDVLLTCSYLFLVMADRYFSNREVKVIKHIFTSSIDGCFLTSSSQRSTPLSISKLAECMKAIFIYIFLRK